LLHFAPTNLRRIRETPYSPSSSLPQEINPSISSTDNDVKQTVDVGRALVRAALGETLL
jgi:hypothetical protein